MRYWGFALCHADSGTAASRVLTEVLDLVQLADRCGLDGWFFPEHHGNHRHSVSTSPNLLIAAASRVTRTIRLGAMVSIVPFQHPLRLAEEIRLLGLLTDGRVDVGLGPGGFREHAYWGIDTAVGPRMFETGLCLLRRLLAEGDFEFQTEWWSGLAPPLPDGEDQRSQAPLWLATVREQSVANAAELGLNCDSAFTTYEVLPRRLDLYRTTWERHHPGMAPGTFSVVADVTVAENGQEARAMGEEFHRRKLARFKSFFASPPHASVGTEDRKKMDEAYRQLSVPELVDKGLAICGTVDDCVEQVRRLRSTGVDAMTAWMPFGELESDAVCRSVRLFCEAVIPAVEGR